jgi:hypothetical protein
MRGVWLVIAVGLAGCTSAPKRELRQPVNEELATPPAHMYLTPPDVPRDKPLLTPKGPPPNLNTAPAVGGPGMGAVGFGPGAGAMPR